MVTGFSFSVKKEMSRCIFILKRQRNMQFWIQPLFVAVNFGFTGKELREIGEIIEKNEVLIRDKWNEHFGK